MINFTASMYSTAVKTGNEHADYKYNLRSFSHTPLIFVSNPPFFCIPGLVWFRMTTPSVQSESSSQSDNDNTVDCNLMMQKVMTIDNTGGNALFIMSDPEFELMCNPGYGFSKDRLTYRKFFNATRHWFGLPVCSTVHCWVKTWWVKTWW